MATNPIDKDELIKSGALVSIIGDFQSLRKELELTDGDLKKLATSFGELKSPNNSKEFAELNAKVKSLEAVYKEQHKTIERLNKVIAEEAKLKKEATKQNQEVIGTLKESNKEWREQTSNIKENARAIIDQKNELSGVRDRMKEIANELGNFEKFGSSSQEARDRIAELNAEMTDLTIEETKLKVSISQTNIMMKAQAKEVMAVDGSMQQANQTLGQMRTLWRQMTDEEKSSPFGQTLLAQIKEMDKGLKEADAEIGNFQRSVGNYASAFDDIDLQGLSTGFTTLARSLSANVDSTNSLVTTSKALSGVFGSMQSSMRASRAVIESASNSMAKLATSTTASTTATRAATIASKGLAGAMKLIPIVAIIAGIISLIGWYKNLTQAKEEDLAVEKESNDELERGEKLRGQRANSQRDINDLVRNANKLSQGQLKALKSELEREIALSDANEGAINLSKERIEARKESIRLNRENTKALKDELALVDQTTAAGIKRAQELNLRIALLEENFTKEFEMQKLTTKGIKLTDNEIANLKLRREQLSKVNSLIIDNSRATRDNNSAKAKANDLTLEQIKYEKDYSELVEGNKVLDFTTENIEAQTELFRKDLQERLTMINDAERNGLISEEIANEQRLLAESDFLHSRLRLLDAYGVDSTDLENEISENKLQISKLFSDKVEEITVESFKNTINQLNESYSVFKSVSDEMLDELITAEQKIQSNSQTMIDSLKAGAEAGTKSAKDSILAEEKAIEESQKRIDKMNKRKEFTQLIQAGLSTYNSAVSGGANPLEALGQTAVNMSGLVAMLKALPSFDVGADRLTGDGRGVDGKGGFLAINHPDERIMTAEQNAIIGYHHKNSDIANIMSFYNKGLLKPVHEMGAVVAYDNSEVLDRIDKGFSKINNWNISTEELFGNISVLIEKSKNGDIHRYRRNYKA